jgi:hypothetical protein
VDQNPSVQRKVEFVLQKLWSSSQL